MGYERSGISLRSKSVSEWKNGARVESAGQKGHANMARI